MHDEGDHRGEDCGTGDTLHEPGGDQHAGRRCEAAAGCGCGEGNGPGDEHVPVADDVSHGAARDQQRSDRERERIDDPLALGETGVQICLDRGHADRDGGGVHQEQERPEAAGSQSQRALESHDSTLV